LEAGDVRPYGRDGQDPKPERNAQLDVSEGCRDIDLESLDVIELGPFLLLLAAQEKAETLVDEARAQAKALGIEARAEGAAQGREEAMQEALPSAVALANAGQALIVFEEQMIARYAPELARLALEIAEKIVHRTVAAEPEIVASVLERARREVVDARWLRIRLNPADHELLAEMRPDLITMGNDKGRVIEVVSDVELSRGGCRLETEMGVVDATMPTQIAEMRRQFLDEDAPKTYRPPVPSERFNAAVMKEL
jgi:flagellar assembly protein FliH